MSGYEIYTLVLCAIVFILLASVLSFLASVVMSFYVRLVRAGLEDKDLEEEYGVALQTKGKGKWRKAVSSALFAVFFLVFFGITIALNVMGNVFFADIPTLKMVNSGSMSQKHVKNTYLVENNLDDQFNTFDLVLLYKAPEEMELQLYDVILYEVDGAYVIHRIVKIEEANEEHPNERYFLCCGDANEYADRFPVLYSQIRGIYRGQRIPYVGSFVAFLQSPAGWLCIFYAFIMTIVMPLAERKIRRERAARWTLIAQARSDYNWILNLQYWDHRRR